MKKPATLEDEIVKKAVWEALKQLFADDHFLLEADANERTIAAKLAEYLERSGHFPQHKVDVEYNRHGVEPKAVYLSDFYRGKRKKRIFPDIIVHQRGHDEENVLVIQIKKETNHEPRAHDAAVVAAMKEQFHYRLGLLLDLPAGKEAATRKPHLEWR